LGRVRAALEKLAGRTLSDARLRAGIRAANRVRRLLQRLRRTVYGAAGAPLPALEMLVAEMLAIHFCSDRAESRRVLAALVAAAEARVAARQFIIGTDAVRVYWVNPVADLRAMNLLEACGGRLCGADFMFTHALDPVPEDLPPLEALARCALADPMAGPAADRARRIVAECCEYRAEAVVIARIPGASHCPWEAAQIGGLVGQAGLPVVEVEIPPVSDALRPALRTRLQALVETAQARRKS
jgi:hypothetical protein